MALIKCSACNREVSEAALACPSCGHPFRASYVKTAEDNVLTRNRGCGDIILFGPIILIVILVASC